MAPIGERGGDRMDKKITYWQTVCFLFLSVMGTLLHFLFDWSGGSWAAALIAPVNESIWEHLKLLVFPMVAFALAQSRWSGIDPRKVLAAKGKGLVVGLILIPVLYYLVSGSLGTSPEWFNIALFFLAAAAACWVDARALRRGESSTGGWAILAGIVCVFWIFTFFPPRIPLFQDPITGTWGYFG